jgi:NifU-like protein involved in Fe-S cluster formation
MIEELYQKELLRHAAAARGHGRLDGPDASVTLDNPLCGDRVTIDINVSGTRVSEVGQVVRACLLCQATASIIGERAVGHSADDVRGVIAATAEMLSDGGTPPGDGWEEMAAFTPVAEHKSRHQCVLLPLEALVQAIEKAAEGAAGYGAAPA